MSRRKISLRDRIFDALDATARTLNKDHAFTPSRHSDQASGKPTATDLRDLGDLWWQTAGLMDVRDRLDSYCQSPKRITLHITGVPGIVVDANNRPATGDEACPYAPGLKPPGVGNLSVVVEVAGLRILHCAENLYNGIDMAVTWATLPESIRPDIVTYIELVLPDIHRPIQTVKAAVKEVLQWAKTPIQAASVWPAIAFITPAQSQSRGYYQTGPHMWTKPKVKASTRCRLTPEQRATQPNPALLREATAIVMAWRLQYPQWWG